MMERVRQNVSAIFQSSPEKDNSGSVLSSPGGVVAKIYDLFNNTRRVGKSLTVRFHTLGYQALCSTYNLGPVIK